MLTKVKLSRQQTRRLYHTAILIGIACLLIIVFITLQPFTHANWWLSDQLFASEPPSPNIVIVGIDDNSLKTYGKWAEWQRGLHAQAIDNLSRAGAGVIGFDVLFADVSSADSTLAAAIKKAGNVVLAIAGTEPVPYADSRITYSQFLFPAPALRQASASSGHANVISDGDGMVRRLSLVTRDTSGQVYPAFSLAILHLLFAEPLPQEYLLSDAKLNLLDRDVPVDTRLNMRVNFTSASPTYTTLSYRDVIEGNFDPAVVKHKIVLIGMTATGDLDTWLTPVSRGKLPGVWIHACAIDTILRQRFLEEAGTNTTLLTMILLAAVTVFTLPRLKLKWGGILTGGLFIVYLLVTFFAFDSGYILNILYPSLQLPIIYAASVICRVTAEQSDNRFVRGLFGKYVSSQVVTEILNAADSGELHLRGQRRTVTVLFADLRGFTVISERVPVEVVVDTLNCYLSVIIDHILAHEGMVNKFAGDSIMAVWNAPHSQPQDHARLAVQAAWEAQEAIKDLQRKDSSLLKAEFGMGINSGEVIAGNIGSSGRAEYTVIGDAVNLASRICGASTGGEVWIGRETHHLVKEYIEADELEPRSLKGKAEPVVIYRVVGITREGGARPEDKANDKS